MILFTIKTEPKYVGLPNKLHLQNQQTYRMNIFKPKKGKGSYNRQKFKKASYDF